MSPAGRRRWLPLLVAVVLLGAGCAEPEIVEPDPEPDHRADDPIDVPVPPDAELAAALEELTASVAATRTALAQVTGATDAASAARAAEAALAQLLAAGPDDPPPTRPAGTPPPLLPADSPERTTSAPDRDALTTALTAARAVGGERGQGVVELLRDPVAGDLGAWQRDAAGLVDGVRRLVAASQGIAELEREVLELSGEATRALAWTFAAVDADDLATAQAAAERAAVHLELIALVLDPEPS